jgi:hypothetical protein
MCINRSLQGRCGAEEIQDFSAEWGVGADIEARKTLPILKVF